MSRDNQYTRTLEFCEEVKQEEIEMMEEEEE